MFDSIALKSNFCLFQLYIAVMSYHALYLAISHTITCMGSEFQQCKAYSPPATMIFLLFLMFEGLLFALFTSIMFGTQVTAIWHDQTVSSPLLPLSSNHIAPGLIDD